MSLDNLDWGATGCRYLDYNIPWLQRSSSLGFLWMIRQVELRMITTDPHDPHDDSFDKYELKISNVVCPLMGMDSWKS